MKFVVACFLNSCWGPFLSQCASSHSHTTLRPLPTPLWNKDDHEVCLFVKDRAGEGHKAAKKRLAEVEGPPFHSNTPGCLSPMQFTPSITDRTHHLPEYRFIPGDQGWGEKGYRDLEAQGQV